LNGAAENGVIPLTDPRFVASPTLKLPFSYQAKNWLPIVPTPRRYLYTLPGTA